MGRNRKNDDDYYTKKSMNSSIRRRIVEKYNNKCYICGSKYKLEVHHIQPVGLDGVTKINNLVLLCRSCHCAIETGDIYHAIKKCVINATKQTRV